MRVRGRSSKARPRPGFCFSRAFSRPVGGPAVTPIRTSGRTATMLDDARASSCTPAHRACRRTARHGPRSARPMPARNDGEADGDRAGRPARRHVGYRIAKAPAAAPVRRVGIQCRRRLWRVAAGRRFGRIGAYLHRTRQATGRASDRHGGRRFQEERLHIERASNRSVK